MILPFLVFWIIIFLSKGMLSGKARIGVIFVWLILFSGMQFFDSGVWAYWFAAAQALLDCIIILIVFGGDIRIR